MPSYLILTEVGESQVTEEAMAKVAKIMEDRKICQEDQGSVFIDFTQQVPGKEGKRLGKTILRYDFSTVGICVVITLDVLTFY